MVVLDIETTGLDPDKHAIVSVGAVEFENPDNQFYEECRIPEDAEVDPKALEINSFTQEELTDGKQSPKLLMKSFINWIKNCEEQTIAGHSVHKDWSFLNAAAEKYDVSCPEHDRIDCFHDRIIDTHSLVWMDMVQKGKELPKNNSNSYISSDFAFDYVGIDYKRDTHNALEDAKLTAEAISRLLYDKQLFAEFA